MKMSLIRACVLCAICLYSPPNLNADITSVFDEFVQTQMNTRNIPGIAAALVGRKGILFSKGYGVSNKNTNAPVDADTLFHIGSTNKSVTALMLARLIEQGNYSWSSTVAELAPDLNFSDNWLANVRLEELMNMTSGIRPAAEDDFYNSYPSDDSVTPEGLLSFTLGMRLASAPGSSFRYSNMSVSLAGYLVTRNASGARNNLNRAYSDLLHATLLAPAEMERTTVFVSEARSDSNYAVGHRGSRVTTSEDHDNDAFAPAGSLKSSANDMAAYLYLYVTKGKSLSGQRLFRRKTLRKLWRPSKVSGVEKYALGWERQRYNAVKVLIHEGAFDNFTSVIGVLPKQKLAYVILVNTENTGALLSDAHKVLIDALR